MSDLISLPGQAYTYIDSHYGLVGLIVVGLMIVVTGIGVMIFFDRRR
jgi:hypothetical protein